MNSLAYLISVLLTVLLVNCAETSRHKVLPRAANEEYRLPTTITPINYKITLILDDEVFSTNKYIGMVVLRFLPERNTQMIKLHTSNITISLLQVRTPEDLLVPTLSQIQDPSTDILTIQLSQELFSSTEYTMTVSYEASLTVDEMYGFYKSSYADENGNIVYLATTQFQPTYARRVFPCFDEPSFKATFDISLRHPSKFNAIGNTPIKESSTARGITTTVFETTPNMSTYLIAFIVSDFTCTTTPSSPSQTVTHRVCSRDEARPTRRLAVDLGPQFLAKLEDFTGILYNESGIGKLDQVAIPDFAAGAMENWGLVTYRERYLLWDSSESSNRYKQNVATIVTHELSHMWFGDLITTHWWSDSFLNEGFATYFEYFTTHEVLPTWELDKQFVVEQIHPVLETDSSLSTNALSHEVYTPQEVSGRFTSISYNKGGAIFRMVESFLGTESYKAAINRYLNTYRYRNTRPADLWNAFNIYGNGLPASVLDLMDNWTNKPGFPLITVRVNGSDIIISQSRFLLNGTDTTKWYVPISYTKSNDANKFSDTLPKLWLTPGGEVHHINNTLTDDVDWIILNNKQTGYYRVDYDESLWNKIASALSEKEDFDGIVDLNRAEIVNDLFSLAKVNRHDYNRVFQWTSFLAKDTSYYPWYAALNAYSLLLQRTGKLNLRSALSAHILNLMKVVYDSVPFTETDDENQIYTLKKVLVLTWACRLAHTGCVSNATTAFNSYRDYGGRPNPNIRAIVYCNGLRHSENIDEDWNFLWQKYGETKDSAEKVTIISALGCANDANIINRYLHLSINESSGIKRQDALAVFSAVYTNNQNGVDYALDFLIEYYREIADYYASMNSLLSIVNGLSPRITTQAQLDKLQKFVDESEIDDSIRESARGAIATAAINLEWTESFEKQLTAYFKLDTGAASTTKSGIFVALIVILLIYTQFY